MLTSVNVIYHYEDGSWWADSPDIARWSAAASEITDLVELVVEGVPFALESDDVDITHTPAPDLIDVFRGRTVGGRLRLDVSAAFRGLLPDPPRVAAPAGGTPIACGS